MGINLTSPIKRSDTDTLRILRVDLDLRGKKVEIQYANGHVEDGTFVSDESKRLDIRGEDLKTLMSSNPTGGSVFKRLMKALYGYVKDKESIAGTVTDDSID